MKTIPLILFTKILFLLACTNKNKPETNTKHIKNINKYYLYHSATSTVLDTIPYNESSKSVDGSSKLIGKFLFIFNNEEDIHSISKYVYESETDSTVGNVSYTLDDLGVIYNKSYAYPTFAKLSSNNDSLNKLIETSLNYTLLDQFGKW
jgi:hypothetical protein